MPISIFTDASCLTHVGLSGWAALIYYQDKTVELSGVEKCGKNNRMELLAVIKALSTLPQDSEVTIYTDSQYVMRGSSQFKRPDANADLWSKLDQLKPTHKVVFNWVRAHSGCPHNGWADWKAKQVVKKRAREIYGN